MKLWELRRPAFAVGTEVINEPTMPFVKPSIVVKTDYERPATFRDPGTTESYPADIGVLRKRDEDEYGAKVQLSEKTLEKLFDIRVDDPTDVEYQAKKKELEDLGMSSEKIKAILGKPRQITKRVNIADASLNADDRLELIERAIQDGFQKTRQGFSGVMGQAAMLAGDDDFLEDMDGGQERRLKQVIAKMAIPDDPLTFGLGHVLMSRRQYRQQDGIINMYLMANLQPPLTINKPVRGVQGAPVDIYRLDRLLDGNKYLDLSSRRIISERDAMVMANEGVDNGTLDGIPRPEGGWQVGMPLAPQGADYYSGESKEEKTMEEFFPQTKRRRDDKDDD